MRINGGWTKSEARSVRKRVHRRSPLTAAQLELRLGARRSSKEAGTVHKGRSGQCRNAGRRLDSDVEIVATFGIRTNQGPTAQCSSLVIRIILAFKCQVKVQPQTLLSAGRKAALHVNVKSGVECGLLPLVYYVERPSGLRRRALPRSER